MMTVQLCSPAYRINIRSIREFYETKITFTSARDENVIGALRDTADCILEQLQDEECSLAHHARALSILLWVVEILEYTGTPLDPQTRDEVESCANALTGEYLRRGRYNRVDVFWALEWASKRTIEEMAPQVPDSFFEDTRVWLARIADAVRDEHFARVVSVSRLAGLARLAGGEGFGGPEVLTPLTRLTSLASLAFLARIPRLMGILALAGLPRLPELAGHPRLAGLVGLVGVADLANLGGVAGLAIQRGPSSSAYADIPHCASIARLALDDTPEREH